jgi:hypothetical protein
MVAPDGETLVTSDDEQNGLDAGGIVKNYAAFHELRKDCKHLVVTKWNPEEHEVERLRFEATEVEGAHRLCSLETVDGQAVEVLYDIQGRIERLQQRREGRAYILFYDSCGRVTEVRLSGRTLLQKGDSARRTLAGNIFSGSQSRTPQTTNDTATAIGSDVLAGYILPRSMQCSHMGHS